MPSNENGAGKPRGRGIGRKKPENVGPVNGLPEVFTYGQTSNWNSASRHSSKQARSTVCLRSVMIAFSMVWRSA